MSVTPSDCVVIQTRYMTIIHAPKISPQPDPIGVIMPYLNIRVDIKDNKRVKSGDPY